MEEAVTLKLYLTKFESLAYVRIYIDVYHKPPYSLRQGSAPLLTYCSSSSSCWRV